jgi:diguanylate cyclase (GGDEF)-like protein/PAS domain S-box-containing protein
MESDLDSRLFKAIIDNSDDAIISKTTDGIVTSWNRGAAAIFGYTADEMVGKPMLVLLPPGREDEEQNILAKIRRGEKVDHFETVRRRKDGSLIDVSVTISPLRDNDGNIVGASKIARDITERKVVEQQLVGYAAQVEDLYFNAPCGYHSLDENGVFVFINETELNWLGCKREDVVGKMKLTDFLSPASQGLFAEMYPQFLAKGQIDNLELELISKKGDLIRVNVNATAIRDNLGNYLYSRSVLFDITELKKTQDELQRLTIEQQAMLDNELVGIVKLRNRKVLWINKAMEQIFGYGAGEIDGQPSRILYPDDVSFNLLGESAYPIIKENGIYRTQIELQRKDGGKIWIDLSGMQLADSNGESLWMMLDISLQKDYQQEIERIAHHDMLTGLPNRLLVSDRMKQALSQAGRSNQSLAVCYLDLDGFKQVNDKFGHNAGDKLLLEIASRMQKAVRAYDTVARMGGDEFVLLLPSNPEDADNYQLVVQRIMDVINTPVSLDDDIEVKVGVSIGVAVFPSDSGDPDLLLRHADSAMYQAKKSGRNRICLYGEADPKIML